MLLCKTRLLNLALALDLKVELLAFRVSIFFQIYFIESHCASQIVLFYELSYRLHVESDLLYLVLGVDRFFS